MRIMKAACAHSQFRLLLLLLLLLLSSSSSSSSTSRTMLDEWQFLGKRGGGKSKTFCALWHDLTTGSSGFATAIHAGLTSDFSVSTYVIVREVRWPHTRRYLLLRTIKIIIKKTRMFYYNLNGETRSNTSCKHQIALFYALVLCDWSLQKIHKFGMGLILSRGYDACIKPIRTETTFATSSTSGHKRVIITHDAFTC